MSIVQRKNPTKSRVYAWLGRQGSNLRMPGPKPGALPLGHGPINAERYYNNKPYQSQEDGSSTDLKKHFKVR